jgi:hypothetical protein
MPGIKDDPPSSPKASQKTRADFQKQPHNFLKIRTQI